MKRDSYLKVISFNTWLLPFRISRDNKIRKRNLVPNLIEYDADIYALQEVWNYSDKRAVIKEFKKYGYNYHYHSSNILKKMFGILGNGLLIISRLPLEGKSHLEFNSNTRMDEYLVSKGAIHCVIKVGSLSIDFYNVHLGSIYFDSKNKIFPKKEIEEHNIQLKEFENFVKKTNGKDIIIVAGDLNWPLKEFDHQQKIYIKKESEKIKNFRTELKLEKNMDLIEHHTYSYDNKYSKQDTIGGLVDYIMSNNHKSLKFKNHRIILKDNLAETGKTLSDHYGILTTFKIKN